jgi:hypothetical protein
MIKVKSRKGMNQTMPHPHLERVLVTVAFGTLGYIIVRHLGKTHPENSILLLMRRPDPALFADLANVTMEQVNITDSPRMTQADLDFQPNAIIHARPAEYAFPKSTGSISFGSMFPPPSHCSRLHAISTAATSST